MIDEIKAATKLINEIKFKEIIEKGNKEFTWNKDNFFSINDNGKKKVNITGVTNEILTNYSIKTIYSSKSTTMFIYEDGIFTNKGNAIINNIIENLLKDFATFRIVNEIIKKIQRKTMFDFDEFMKIKEDKICINNCVLDFSNLLKIEMFEICSLDPKYVFKSKLNMDYNPKAKCPKLLEFFEKSFYPADIPVIQEWLGYSLFNRYAFKKALLIQGITDTGKTVFLNVFKHFLGLKNICSISLQKLTGLNNFAISGLYGKSANVVDELESNDLESTGNFKVITGGGLVGAEKKFQDAFSFVNFAKLMFACNKIPSVKNNDIEDDAYYSRWLLISMNNQVSKNEMDEFLINKLTTIEETSGLLNWALKGLIRLFKNKGFSYHKTAKQNKEIMQRNSNPLMDFIKLKVIVKNGNCISKNDFYEFYNNFCLEHNYPIFSKNQLSRKLSLYLPNIRERHDKVRSWINIDVLGLKGNDLNENKIRSCSKCNKEFVKNELKDLLVGDNTFYFCKDCYDTAKTVVSKREIIV